MKKPSEPIQHPHKPIDWHLLIEIGLIVVVLVAYLLITIQLDRLHDFPMTRRETDGIEYLWMSEGPIGTINEFHGPGYPTAIRLFRVFLPDSFSAAKSVSIFFGLLMLFSTWLIARRLIGRYAGILAAALVILCLEFLTYSVMILSDIMAASLCVASLAVLIVPLRPKAIHFAISGALAAAAYLTRSVYVILIILPILWLIFAPGERRVRARLIDLGIFLSGWLVVASPWLVHVAIQKGDPFWSHNYYNLAFKMYRGDEGWNALSVGEQYTGWLDVIRSNPGLFLTGWLETLRQFPGGLLALIPSAILGGLGLFLWIPRLDWRKLILVVVSLGLAVITCLVWLEARFLFAFLPLLAILVTEAIFIIPQGKSDEELPPWISRFIRIIPWRVLACIILISLSFLPLKGLSGQFEDQALEYRAAANWLDVNKPENASIFAAKPHIAYFSGSKYFYFRDYNLEDLEITDLPALLEQIHPTYMIFDQRYSAGQFPQFQALLDPQTNPLPDMLTPVYIIDLPFRLVIYEVHLPSG